MRLVVRPGERAHSDEASPQALLGFEHKLTHLDGHNITLSRKGVTQPGTSRSPAYVTGMLIAYPV